MKLNALNTYVLLTKYRSVSAQTGHYLVNIVSSDILPPELLAPHDSTQDAFN